MKLLKEDTEMLFLSEESAVAFYQEQEKNEIWKTCYTHELTTFPVPGDTCGLYDAASVKKSCNMEETKISDESILETMDSTKLGLTVPLQKAENYPLSNTAFATLMQRAGYSSAPAIASMKSKPTQKEMSPNNKAQVLNMGLRCFENKALVLIRDEKVRAVLSGDENDYSRLPVSALYKKMKEEIEAIYPDWSFEMSTVSHQFTTIQISLNDRNLEADISDIFKKSGRDIAGKPVVKMITSDVGLSGANIFPILKTKMGNEFPLGLPLCLTHNNRHSVQDFGKNVAQVNAMFRDAAAKLEKMMVKKVKYPGGCLRVIAKKCTLPKKTSCIQAKMFEETFKDAYEIDVYYKLFDILDEYIQDSSLSAARVMDIQESIARIVFSNMSDYDYPFEWE